MLHLVRGENDAFILPDAITEHVAQGMIFFVQMEDRTVGDA